jgi:hypothetical protein
MSLPNRPRLALSATDAAKLERIWNEHAAGVLGVDEVDPGVRRTAPRLVVEQSHAFVAQALGKGVEVADPAGQLLEARTAFVEELGDRAGVVQGCHQLKLGTAGRRPE